ncbi:MAG: DUF507 family protein [Acidobacteria bacterium]|nr:DUF507 family protein [Acidobacteriota bacterium]
MLGHLHMHAPDLPFVSTKLSKEKITRLSHVISKFLSEDDLVEFHDDPNEIRLTVVRVINDEMKRDNDIDRVVKRKIETHKRPIIEGSREWDILYKKYFEEEVSRLRRFSE